MQVWWAVVEFAGCEWIACTVPITHTRAMQRTHTALKNVSRIVAAFAKWNPITLRCKKKCCSWTILSLNGHLPEPGKQKS